jgi:colanic acid/amylovoran biosynthesis glycosyltransferase
VKRDQGSVLYLQGFLPTYIHREVTELARLGVRVHVILPESDPRASMWDAITGVQASSQGELRISRWLPYSWLRLPVDALKERAPREVVSFLEDGGRGGPIAARCLEEDTLEHLMVAIRLAQRLEGEAIARVHVHFAAELAEVGILLAELLDVPFTVTTHAFDIFVPRKPLRLKRLLERASRIFTISDYNRDYMEALAGRAIADRIEVTRLGLDLELLPQRRARRTDVYRILCTASGLVEKKGVPYLLEACGILLQRGVPLRCTIAGADPAGEVLARLRSRSDELGLAGAVSLPGRVPSRELMAWVGEADVFALPCIHADSGDRDGIPVSLMEAMGIGAPVISTPVSGIPELIQDGDSGLLVPPRDARALADALQRVFERPGEAERMARRGRQIVQEKFSLARYAAQLIECWGRS